MNSLWIKNGLIVKNQNSKLPVLCNKCPCNNLVPAYFTPYSYVHYANGTSTAGQKVNRLTMTVEGHSLEMVLDSRSYSENLVTHELGLSGFTGKSYDSSFLSEDGTASIGFSLYLCTATSDVCDRIYQGKFYNKLTVWGSAVIDDIQYTMSGFWRNLTNAPISEGGSVENGVPLPFDLAVSVEEGKVTNPASLNLSGWPNYDPGWKTEAKGSWTIGPGRYDETVQWVYYTRN